MSTTLWMGQWSSLEELAKDFEINPEDHADYDIFVGYYSYEDYSGDSYVLARHIPTGELRVNTAGHCSCYGLEGTWSPEKTLASVELKGFDSKYKSMPFKASYKGEEVFVEALRKLLTELAAQE